MILKLLSPWGSLWTHTGGALEVKHRWGVGTWPKCQRWELAIFLVCGQQLCSAGILFCRCPVCLVTSSSHISHLTVRSRRAVYGHLQGSKELLASTVQMPHRNMFRNLSLHVGGPGMWVGGSTVSFHVEVVIWQAVGASPQPGWIWRPCGMSHH